ncbi:uncharacterized protein A4U43_C09F14660 [Asparagus officinalis]|uniref:F-box associated beta-propeller type 3 domain-containing protein n=1 Tax=Asparagus officinalis TaxID=4686 RepID=A0A5P1E9G8_ASPOF|nr:uncharacterized protein A4U43_C09F14660 [Asparagus officinalis]
MYNPDDIYIRNPETGEQIALPRKSSGFPEHSGQAVAFAYLPSTGEYKVLRVFGASPFFSLQHPIRRSEVFTLGSGRWREIKEGPTFWVHDENSAVVDEAVHFLPGIFTWRLGGVEATIFSGEGSFFGVSFYVESFMALDDESFESLKKQEAI